eukprot:8727397-Pyramimonas_sp.AAC.1
MENSWGYLEITGCKLKLARPFLDAANEGGKRTADGQEEATAKPPAQPAGGSASSAIKPSPRFGVKQEPRPPPPKPARPPAPPVPTAHGDATAAGSDNDSQGGGPASRGAAARRQDSLGTIAR